MTIEIHIYGPFSRIEGEFPPDAPFLDGVREITSYKVQGAEWSPSYKKKLWDGRKHLMKKNYSFPTGLAYNVRDVIEGYGLSVSLIDHREQPSPTEAGFDLEGITFDYPYDYQLEAAKTCVEKKQGIVRVATNGGKCLHPDTPIRMYDGSVRKARDIHVGDQLMGPDSAPRTVQSTTQGFGPLYEIVQKRGMRYICNDVHVLTLQDCRKRYKNRTIDIPLDEYLAKNAYFKHCFKHFSVGVSYPARDVPIDPYFIGLWLGDGRKDLKSVAVTTMDSEIVEYLQQVSTKWGCSVREDDHSGNRSSTYRLVTSYGKPNALLSRMRELFNSDFRIPELYLINTREVRLQVLAGLLDSDGHAHEGRFYEITQKRRELAEDVYHLARSLGFGATIREKVVDDVTYYRVNVLGVGPGDIPVRLPHKQLTQIRIKSGTRTNFSVRPVGEGVYVGFTLDGDGRFLLEDYTVTHNTEISAAVTKHLGLRTLFIVTTRELLYQSRERFMKRLGVGPKEVGLIGDGHWSPGTWVTIATLDTLESRLNKKECHQFLETIEALFVDECHHLGSETWYKVCVLCPAVYRFGLSGTPLDRTDGADLRLIGAMGDVIVDIDNKFLVERGVSAKAKIIWDKITKPVLGKVNYQTAYKKGVVENPELLARVIEWTKVFRKLGLGVLILTEEIKQGQRIDEALWTETDGEFIPHQYIYGDEDTDVRRQALQDFGSGQLPVLVASTILDEGVDVPTIDALILAGSKKSKIKTMQRLGRGLRGKKLVVVEFANFTSDYLLKHSMQRLRDYKNEECFPIYSSGPDEEFVKNLLEED